MPNFDRTFVLLIPVYLMVGSETAAQTKIVCDAFGIIPHYQPSPLKVTAVDLIKVNQKRYEVIGLLGESNSKVYLGIAPDLRRVAIKQLEIPTTSIGFEEEFIHEVLVTLYLETARVEYYGELGHPTPKLIEMQLHDNQVTIVKEYAEGITYLDLKRGSIFKMEPRILAQYLHDADVLIDNLSDHVRDPKVGFWPWLQKRRLGFESRFPVMATIWELINQYSSKTVSEEYGQNAALYEVRPGNLLLQKSGRWLLFDP